MFLLRRMYRPGYSPCEYSQYSGHDIRVGRAASLVLHSPDPPVVIQVVGQHLHVVLIGSGCVHSRVGPIPGDVAQLGIGGIHVLWDLVIPVYNKKQ